MQVQRETGKVTILFSPGEGKDTQEFIEIKTKDGEDFAPETVKNIVDYTNKLGEEEKQREYEKRRKEEEQERIRKREKCILDNMELRRQIDEIVLPDDKLNVYNKMLNFYHEDEAKDQSDVYNVNTHLQELLNIKKDVLEYDFEHPCDCMSSYGAERYINDYVENDIINKIRDMKFKNEETGKVVDIMMGGIDIMRKYDDSYSTHIDIYWSLYTELKKLSS